MTIGELRKLLLELARYAEEGAGCMYSEGYSDDESEALRARKCAVRAREVEAELEAGEAKVVMECCRDIAVRYAIRCKSDGLLQEAANAQRIADLMEAWYT